MVHIIDFFPNWKGTLSNDWTSQDLAEFYRVEAALSQAGFQVESERGFSDEGDPWIVFCRKEDDEPVVHFARIDGRYVVAAPALPHVLTGSDLREIVKRFIAENPVSIPVLEADRRDESNRRDNVLLHPAALLTVFVATILVMSLPSESLAAGSKESEDETGSPETSPVAALPETENDDGQHVSEKILLIAAVAVAVEIARQQGSSSEKTPTDIGSTVSAALKGDSGSQEVTATNNDLWGLSEAGLLMGSVTGDDSVVEEEEAPLPENRVPEVSEGSSLPDGSIETWVEPDVTPPSREGVGSLLAEADEVVLLHTGDSASTEDHPTPEFVFTSSGSEARAWLEHHLETRGLHIVLLSEESGMELAGLVDKSTLVPHPEQEAIEAGSVLSSSFDDAALMAILHFVNSDDDIAIVSSDITGSILIFDQSDLASGESLVLRTWAFDDDTVIGILGHSDTIADALALAA